MSGPRRGGGSPTPKTERPGRLFAIAAPGLEGVVAEELRERGFGGVREVPGGVGFDGDALRANRALATPTRILRRVATFPAEDFIGLERGVYAAGQWLEAFGDVGFTVSAASHRSKLYHTGAIEERVAARVPAGPLEMQVRIDRDVCTLSVDTSGELLHKRGWRLETGAAPLRETLAAALLRMAGWRPGMPLFDPMCGSGTFLIEAATWAAGLAPGRLRSFACESFCLPSETPTWPAVPTAIAGSDRARPAVDAARRNAERAGVTVGLSVLEAAHANPGDTPPGLVMANPPYDRRAAGGAHALERLRLALNGPFSAWKAAVLLPAEVDARGFERPITGRFPMQNGGIPVALVLLEAASGKGVTP